MSGTNVVCPKCGGRMVRGEVKYLMERSSGQPMVPFADFSFRGLSNLSETVTSSFFWEEKTGEKTGLIFKKDETKQLGISGLRCTICNYIELYAAEK